MPAHKEKLENHHRQSEAVVFLGAIDVSEGHALQLRRSVFRKAGVASVGPAVNRDLKAVDIEQVDRRLPRDQDVFGVQVADDEAVFVNGGDGARDVGRDVDQKGPGGFWEFLEPALGAVQGVNLFGAADLFHDEAGDLAAGRVEQHVDGPAREVEQPVISEAGEGDELLGLLRRRRLVVNLGDQVAAILNFVNLAFGADSDTPS